VLVIEFTLLMKKLHP